MPEGVVVDPVLRQRFSFERSTEADGGEVLRVEIWVEAGGGVTPHVHPAMEERFHVVSGRPSFLSGREWLAAAPGEDVVVPSGARHAYRGSEDVAHIVCEARPPSLLQEFLEDAAGLARAGKLTRRALPRSPSALLQAAVMARDYREMVVLGFPPMPPRLVSRDPGTSRHPLEGPRPPRGDCMK